MTPDPAAAGPDTDAQEAARMMLDGGIRHLPVVDDNGELLGMTSIRDILLELIRTPQ